METISIRSLQHYLYCPHRWGLINIDCVWSENYFVTKANILHERVHSDGHYSARGKQVFTDLEVWNDDLGLYGRVDCLEVKNGSYTIVEHKPSAPKDGLYRDDDALQIYAQKVCVDSVFSCDSDAVVYYADTRKRVPLPFRYDRNAFDILLEETLKLIRRNLEKAIIPDIRTSQNCSGCSMKDLCIPSVSNKRSVKSIKSRILQDLEE